MIIIFHYQLQSLLASLGEDDLSLGAPFTLVSGLSASWISFITNSVSQSTNSQNYPLKKALARTGRVHMGTRKRSAGCGCQKMNMAKNVSTIPQKYPTNAILKQLSQICLKLQTSLFFLKAWSMSNLRQKDMKSPGSTMSPNPTILFLISPSQLRKGKTSFIGKSRFLATVTITSVPQTQKISQKKRAQRSSNPVLVVLRLRLFSATMENSTPKMLLRAQCFVAKQNPTGTHTKAIEIRRAIDSQNFLISSTLCNQDGIFTEKMTFFIDGEKGRASTSRPEIDITMLEEKYTFTMPMKTLLGRNLQRTQMPKRKAEAIRGNCLASLIPITASSSVRSLLQLTSFFLSSLPRRVDNKQPTYTTEQVLRRSCRNTGTTSIPPAILVMRMTTAAKTILLTGCL